MAHAKLTDDISWEKASEEDKKNPNLWVESNNASDRRKVRRQTKEGDFTIIRTPCPTWAYLGLGSVKPLEEGFNIDINLSRKSGWQYGSISLKKINHCCGIVELCLPSFPTSGTDVEECSKPLVNKALEYAEKWGKGLVLLSLAGGESSIGNMRKFFEEHYGFKEVARFKNPNNSGTLITQHLRYIGNCQVPNPNEKKESA